MRKVITAIFLCAAIAACAGAFAGDTNVRVFVNNRQTKLNPAAIVRDGKAYVGIRGVAKALHASAKWDEKSGTAVVTVGNKRTRFARSDGSTITIGSELFLPLRATGEAVGCTVEWDRADRAIKITTEAPCPIGGG